MNLCRIFIGRHGEVGAVTGSAKSPDPFFLSPYANILSVPSMRAALTER
jgi:hypothetical protein